MPLLTGNDGLWDLSGTSLCDIQSFLVQIGTDQVELGKDGDVRDQAKQWLSAGREWLSGASKKVAQAVKDTQTQINNRLEELDTRHSQGCKHALSLDWPETHSRKHARESCTSACVCIGNSVHRNLMNQHACQGYDQAPS